MDDRDDMAVLSNDPLMSPLAPSVSTPPPPPLAALAATAAAAANCELVSTLVARILPPLEAVTCEGAITAAVVVDPTGLIKVGGSAKSLVAPPLPAASSALISMNAVSSCSPPSCALSRVDSRSTTSGGRDWERRRGVKRGALVDDVAVEGIGRVGDDGRWELVGMME